LKSRFIHKNSIRYFNSNATFKIRDLIVDKDKEHSLPMVYKKSIKSSLLVKEISKDSYKYSNDHRDSKSNNVMENLKLLNPKKDGSYVKITANFLGNSNFLKLVYEYIKNKEINMMIHGKLSKNVLYSIPEIWFIKTAKLLKEGKYIFTIIKQIKIKKKNNHKEKFIIVRNSRDKIVLKSIYFILHKIYVNKDKNAHSVLDQIKKE
jgi:hypothetical protein